MGLLFDGVDDRVNNAATSGLPSGAPMTMCCVLRVTDLANDQGLIQCGDDGVDPNYGWYINNTSGTPRIYCGSNAADGATAVSTAAWIFLGISSATTASHRYFCYNYETRAVVFNDTSTVDVSAFSGTGGGTAQLGAYNASGAYSAFLKSELAWLALYTMDLTLDAGSGLQAIAFLGPYAIRAPAMYFDFNESSGTAARERIVNNTWTLTNFPASPWRAVNLPGPWWTRSAHRVIRPQAVAAATNPGLLHYNAPGNQLTPHYPRAVPF